MYVKAKGKLPFDVTVLGSDVVRCMIRLGPEISYA